MLAADYDPSLDRREDEQKRIRDTVHPKGGAIEEEEVEEEVEDDVDDMFAVAMGDKKPRRVTKVSVSLSLATRDSWCTQQLHRRRKPAHLR